MTKPRDGENPVTATSSSPPRVGMLAFFRQPGRAGESIRLAVVRVMQMIRRCLTLLREGVKHCGQVVTWPRSWMLWSARRPLVACILVVEPLVLAWAAAESVRAGREGIGWAAWGWLALLLLAAAGYVVFTDIAEERRRGQHGNATHIDHTSVVFFGGAILLPVPLAVALIALVRFHRWRIARKDPYRYIYATVAIMASALGVHTVADLTPVALWVRGDPSASGAGVGLGLLGALAAYFAAQAVLVGSVRGIVSKVRTQPCNERDSDWRRQLLIDMVGDLFENAEIVIVLMVAMGIVALAMLWSPLLLLAAPIGVACTVVVQMLEEHREAADTDRKTGLLNAEAFNARATTSLAAAARSGKTLSVLMMDLDHFKTVNDTWGHLAGDQVLRGVADAIQAEVRAGGLVGRFGGEEMVALLPDTGLADALVVAERVRVRVEELEFLITERKGGNPVILAGRRADGTRDPREVRTVSIGVAEVPQHGTTLAAAIAAADEAVYTAKASGRNQVCAAPRPAAADETSPAPAPSS